MFQKMKTASLISFLSYRSQCCSRSFEATLGMTSDSSSNHSNYPNNKRVRVGDVKIETKIQLNEDDKKRRQVI